MLKFISQNIKKIMWWAKTQYWILLIEKKERFLESCLPVDYLTVYRVSVRCSTTQTWGAILIKLGCKLILEDFSICPRGRSVSQTLGWRRWTASAYVVYEQFRSDLGLNTTIKVFQSTGFRFLKFPVGRQQLFSNYDRNPGPIV